MGHICPTGRSRVKVPQLGIAYFIMSYFAMGIIP